MSSILQTRLYACMRWHPTLEGCRISRISRAKSKGNGQFCECFDDGDIDYIKKGREIFLSPD